MCIQTKSCQILFTHWVQCYMQYRTSIITLSTSVKSNRHYNTYSFHFSLCVSLCRILKDKTEHQSQEVLAEL